MCSSDLVSAHTVGQMYDNDIIANNWWTCSVREKIKKQLRITTDENDVIIKVDLIDFDQPQIQDLLEKAYEHARKQIAINPEIGYTEYKGYWAFFEQCHMPKNKAYSFRISDSDMDKLISNATSTFQNIFDYDN